VAAVNRALSDPGLRQRVADAGFIPGGGSSEDASALLRRDAAKYADLIRRANIKFE
jgi:tripartite-type tricarboxylate transporter receptor subunit TctC